MNEPQNTKTATLTQETAPESTATNYSFEPLTHRIPVHELEAIRACLVDPADAQVAQKLHESRDKNDEGRKRPPPLRKDNTMNLEQVSSSPTNGSLDQSTPPAVPRSESFTQSMNTIAAVPYKKVALSGVVWGACFGASATLITLGIKKAIARFSASPDDDFTG